MLLVSTTRIIPGQAVPPFLAWTLFRCQSAQEIVVYQAAYRRCTVHFYRKVLPREARPKCSKAPAMSKAIHAIESRETAAKTLPNAVELDSLRLKAPTRPSRDKPSEEHCTNSRAL